MNNCSNLTQVQPTKLYFSYFLPTFMSSAFAQFALCADSCTCQVCPNQAPCRGYSLFESASSRSSIASLPALFIFPLNIPLPFSVDTFLASIIQYPLTLLIFHSYLLFSFDCAGSSFLRELFSSYGCRLLIMVAEDAEGLISKHTDFRTCTQGLSSCSSWDLEHRLNSCGAQAQLLHGMWDFPDQGSILRLLYWQADSLQLSHQGITHSQL